MKHRFRDGAMIAAAVLLALAACGMYHLGLGWFIFFMICGAVAQAIARGKNRNQAGWFAAGVLFVGFVLVVALLPKLADPAPDGMRAESCPRCNAVQNVPENAPSYTCWRCRYEARLIGMPGMPAAELPRARPALPPPGWYQDPADPTQRRYWDGARWSDPPPIPPMPPGYRPSQTTYERWQSNSVKLAPGTPVKVVATGDEHEGQVGVVQELVNEDEDGLDVCVKFNGEKREVQRRKRGICVQP